MSWKVKEGHKWSFPTTRLTFKVKKVIGGWVGGFSGGPSPSPFPLDFGFWIWDLDLGLDLGLKKMLNFCICSSIYMFTFSCMGYELFVLCIHKYILQYNIYN